MTITRYIYKVIGEKDRFFEYATSEKVAKQDLDDAIRRAELREGVRLRFDRKVVDPPR